MCDVLIAMSDATKNGKIVFGKNSDRPVDECQVLFSGPSRTKDQGRKMRCCYATVPDTADTLATLGCRPYWCWGYETGMNQAGVVGGNAAIFTRARWQPETRGRLGLTGMELLRFGLERGQTAEGAVGMIIELLEGYGQWGSAVQGRDHEEGSYENSFLLADRKEAWVLETAGRRWVAERVVEGVRSISNELTIRDKWTRQNADLEGFSRHKGWSSTKGQAFDFALSYNDHESYARQGSHLRRMRSQQLLQERHGAMDASTMMKILRDHYDDTFLQGPQFHPFLPDFQTLCMHPSPAGFTWGNTATSVVVEIDPDDPTPPYLWVCYLPPCTGLYMAFHQQVRLPDTMTTTGTAGLNVRPAPTAPKDGYRKSSMWWRFNRIAQHVGQNPEERHREARSFFDPLEKRYLDRVGEILTKPPAARLQAFERLGQEEVSDIQDTLDVLEKRWDIFD
jgi:secernin